MKTSSKRGSGSGSGPGAGTGVLDAPGPGYAPAPAWQGRGPAPAGTLQRPYSGFAGSGYGAEGSSFEEFGSETEETLYRGRRGGLRIKLRRLPKSLGGRILLGGSVLAVLGSVAVTVAACRYFMLHDARFVVATSADIQIMGNAHLSRAQVLSVFGDDIERNVFRVSLAERQADLERLPWVAHATVMRLLPNHIRVLITERVPVAFVRQGTQIGLVDASGVLLDMPPESAGDPNYSFPVLTGISAGDPLSTRAARMEIYRRFMDELDSTGQKFSQTVSEVDVSNPEDVKALVYSASARADSSQGSTAGASGGSDILVHFGEQEFLRRYQEFEEHLPEWKQQYPKLASADMRYEGQIVLEMQKGEGAPSAEAGNLAADGGKAKTTTTATADSSAPTPASLRNDNQKSNSDSSSQVGSKSSSKNRGRSLLASTTRKATAKAPSAKLRAAASTPPAKAFWVKNGARARVGGATTP